MMTKQEIIQINKTLDILEEGFQKRALSLFQQVSKELAPIAGRILRNGKIDPDTFEIPGRKRYLALFERYIQELFIQGMTLAEAEVDAKRKAQFGVGITDKPVIPEDAIKWMDNWIDVFGNDYYNDVTADVVKVIQNALGAGYKVPDVMDALGEYLTGSGFNKRRLEVIARTNATTAFNQGRLEAFRANDDFISAVQFIAILDSRVTDICEARNGKIILLSNTELLILNTPPLHYNCRSILSPISRYEYEVLLKNADFKKLSFWGDVPPPEDGFGNIQKVLQEKKQRIEEKEAGKPWNAAKKYDSNVTFDKDSPSQGWKEEHQINGTSFEDKYTGDEWWKKIPEKPIDPPGWPQDIDKAAGKNKSSGIIYLETQDDENGKPHHRIWLVEPSGHYGGYEHTFPKGGIKSGLTSQQTALKEAYEESGLQGQVLFYLGDYEKSTSVTRYYIGVRKGGAPWKYGHETQSVKLVTFDEAGKLLNKDIDKNVLEDLKSYLDGEKLKHSIAITPQQKKEYEDSKKEAEKKAEEQKKALEKAIQKASQPKKDAKLPTYSYKPSKVVSNKPLKVSDFEKVDGQKGSNPGGIYRAKNGDLYYIKKVKSEDQARNEKLANDLYREAGVKVPKVCYAKWDDGSLGIASKFVAEPGDIKTGKDFLVKNGKILHKTLTDGYAADAWLGNWDVVGMTYDNVAVAGKTAYRIDAGGSLLYRAQGSAKGSDWNDKCKEWETLRTFDNTARDVFKNITDKQLYGSALRVTSIPDDRIRELVKLNGISDELAETLIARKQVVLQKQNELKDKFAGVLKSFKELTYSEAREWFKSPHWQNWWNSLTDEERSAFYDYTGSSYSWMNDYLRGDNTNISAQQKRKIKSVSNALTKGECPENVIAWRGFRSYKGFKPMDVVKKGVKPEELIGMEIREKSFTSTALASNASFSGDVKYKVRIPKGTKCGSGFQGRFSNETEILLKENTTLKIIDAKWDGYKLNLEVEVIG